MRRVDEELAQRMTEKLVQLECYQQQSKDGEQTLAVFEVFELA